MIPTIELDQESFQEIFEKSRKRIPILFPEWTNFNENDSGIALLELVSWLKEMQEYHMNQIGEQQKLAYLKLLGMTPKSLTPASGQARCFEVETEKTLPAGTEFMAGEVEFESLEAVNLYSGRLVSVVSQDKETGAGREKPVSAERTNLVFPVFGTKPRPGNSLELAFDQPFQPGMVYGFSASFHFEAGRNPITEEFIPLTEISAAYETVDGWKECELVRDDTRAFLQNGILKLRLPEEEGRRRDGTYHLRIIFRNGTYDVVPVLEYLDLNPVELVQCQDMTKDGPILLGEGTGFPDQSFEAGFSGLLKGSVEIQAENPERAGVMEPWELVEDFWGSGPEDRHFVVKEKEGLICFGNGVHGMMPEGNILLTRAKRTRGILGNVKKGQVHPKLTKQGRLPGFQAVNEENMAGGGREETTEECFERFQAELLRHDCSSTQEDYEELVRRTPGLMIEKAKVVNMDLEKNQVSIAVKPWSKEPCGSLSQEYYENLVRYMDRRRLMGTGLTILRPEYIHISLYLDLELLAYYRNTEDAIEESLRQFFKESQSEFGKPVLYSAIYGFVDSMERVGRVHSLTIDASGQGLQRNMGGDVMLPPNGLAILEHVYCGISYAE